MAESSGEIPQGYLENKKGPQLFQVNEKLQLDKIATAEKTSVIERQISPYEKAYTVGGYSYIVWTEGPKVGDIYQIIPEPSPDQIKNLPTFQEMQTQVLKRLQEIEGLHKEQATLDQADRERRDILEAETGQKFADLYIHLHKLYHGNEKTIGLEQAQLFDLNGEGQKYFDFVARLNDYEKDGYKGYLNELIRTNNLSMEEIDPRRVDNYELEAFKQFYYGKGQNEENIYRNSDDPVILTHHTYGNALATTVELNGLASKTYMESHGVQKRFGGELGGSVAFPPNGVFFNGYPEGNPLIFVGWGRKIGMEYPMVYGINRSHGQNFKTFKGTYQSERFAMNFVPFENISHVFVPGFKTDEVKNIFINHKVENVEILPLGIPELQSKAAGL